jgi:ATP-dependent RNA helicase RhlB
MNDRVLTDLDFDSFALHPTLLSGLHASGFTRLTPIQALSLPEALAGRDVAGEAQTGTGKTAAFLVALMQRLLSSSAKAERRSQDPRAVILAPTRELAVQIHKDAVALGRHTGLRMGLVFGGMDYEKQRRQFDDGVDVLIGTPGRFIDYFKQGVFSLKCVDALVLDEADRMFDLGFIADLRYILRRLSPAPERLNMLFSATLSMRVLELAYEHMNEPQKLTVDAGTKTAARVTQSVYFPASDEKMPLLLGLLATLKPTRSIIFVNTKHIAERIQIRLERAGQLVATLSGDVPQRKRLTLLDRFKEGKVHMIVATDVAARGLHIPDVSHIFNYDLPFDAEDYVHRIGRTARFGSSGQAISFACEQYATSLPDIESYIEATIPRASVSSDLLTQRPERVTPGASTDGADTAEDADAGPDRIRKKPGGGRSGGARSGGPGGKGRPGGRSGGTRSGAGRSSSGGASSGSKSFLTSHGPSDTPSAKPNSAGSVDPS